MLPETLLLCSDAEAGGRAVLGGRSLPWNIVMGEAVGVMERDDEGWGG